MGLLAASATLNLPTKKAMAILPQNSPLQVRTGGILKEQAQSDPTAQSDLPCE